MGVDLRSETGEETRFSHTGWCFYLNLAEEYGWKPLGTLPPATYQRAEPWSGDYDTNEGQRVLRDDSQNLADALQRALGDPERMVREAALAQGWAR